MELGGDGVGLGGVGRVEHDLDAAPAIPEVDEDDAAVVAVTGHPAEKLDLFAGVGGTQRSAIDAFRAAHDARASGRSCQATSRCSPLAISRS